MTKTKYSSISATTERHLCEYLVSPFRTIALPEYLRNRNINFPETPKKVRNRKNYLQKLRDNDFSKFVSICRTHDVSIPSSFRQCESDTDSESDSDDDLDDMSISFDAPPEPQRPTTKQPATEQPTTEQLILNLNNNMSYTGEYGDKIVVHMSHGLIFCAIWTNLVLDPNILQFEITADGKSVVQKELMPEPCIEDLLTSFNLLKANKSHIVTASLDTVMREMNRVYSSKNVWKTSTVLLFDKEVIRQFVDTDGTQTNQIYSDQDDKGRRRIMFFLRTLESMDSGPQPADYNIHCTSSGSGEDEEMQELKKQNEELKKQMTEWQLKQEEMMMKMMQSFQLAVGQNQKPDNATSTMRLDDGL